MSSPVAIPSRSSSRASSTASSPSLSGLYVPVHKRNGSTSSPSSSRCSSPALSESPARIRAPTPTPQLQQAHPFIYSFDALLHLAKSPLARLTPETRESLRENVPEIMTNRKQRKAAEYKNHMQNRAPVQNQNQDPAKVKANAVQQQQQQILTARRTRPTGRVPDSRRRIATKVIDEISWRGRRQTGLVLTPLTPIAV
jgi:hypothetical protein